MNFKQLLKQKNLSRYQLSQLTAIPWETVADIYSGKLRLEDCSDPALTKLSRALQISIEELVQMDDADDLTEPNREPADKSYLETNLPYIIQHDIAALLQGEKDKPLYLDCLYDELYGSINGSLWGGQITEEQAVYLRGKYLYGTEEGG